MSNKFSKLTACLAGVLLASAGQAYASGYSFINLDDPYTVSYSVANGINDAGQVVGVSEDGSGLRHATLWSGGTATNLGALAGSSPSYASGINNSGQVVGYSGNAFGLGLPRQAMLWSGGTATNLGTLSGAVRSSANGINDAGQVVGYSAYDSKPVHATLWSGGTTTDLGPYYSHANGINDAGQVVGDDAGKDIGFANNATLWMGDTVTSLGALEESFYRFSHAKGINSSGQIVGNSDDYNGSAQATMWSGGTAIKLVSAMSSSANAINDAGQVVGEFLTKGDVASRAMLWSEGILIDLNTVLSISDVNDGWVLRTANGINEKGWVVGSASNLRLGIESHAYLLAVTAVPEPETYAMVLAGLGVIGGCMARRRKQHSSIT